MATSETELKSTASNVTGNGAQESHQKEKLHIRDYLGEVRLRGGASIFIGFALDGSLVAVRRIEDFFIDEREINFVTGDMRPNKIADLSDRYDFLIPVAVTSRDFDISNQQDLQANAAIFEIQVTVPIAAVQGNDVKNLAGKTIPLTFTVEQLFDHFRGNEQPFFSLARSRGKSVAAFMILNVPDWILKLPEGKKAGIAISFQHERTAQQQLVDDEGISSVHILADFIATLVKQINKASNGKYDNLLQTVTEIIEPSPSILEIIQKKAIELALPSRSRTILQIIRSRSKQDSEKYPFVLPQLLLTAMANFEAIRESPVSAAENTNRRLQFAWRGHRPGPLFPVPQVTRWLAQNPTRLIPTAPTEIRGVPQFQVVPKTELAQLTVPDKGNQLQQIEAEKTEQTPLPYFSDPRQFPQIAAIDKNHFDSYTHHAHFEHQPPTGLKPHDAEIVHAWIADLSTMFLEVNKNITGILPVLFHVLEKFKHYCDSGTHLNTFITIPATNSDPEQYITITDYITVQAQKLLHKVFSLRPEALERSNFFGRRFSECGGIYFLAKSFTVANKELSEKNLQFWIFANQNRISKLTTPYNNPTVEYLLECIKQSSELLEILPTNCSAEQKEAVKLLLSYAQNKANTPNQSVYPRFITRTETGEISIIDYMLFKKKYIILNDRTVPVYEPESNPDAYFDWAAAQALSFNTLNADFGRHELHNLERLFWFATEDPRLANAHSTNSRFNQQSLPDYCKSMITQMRAQHLEIARSNISRSNLLLVATHLLESVHRVPDTSPIISTSQLITFFKESTNLVNGIKYVNCFNEATGSQLIRLYDERYTIANYIPTEPREARSKFIELTHELTTQRAIALNAPYQRESIISNITAKIE